jgi:hypothetical protein
MADHRFPVNSPALLPQNATAVWNFDGTISYHDFRKRQRMYRRLSLGLPATLYVTWSPSPKDRP